MYWITQTLEKGKTSGSLVVRRFEEVGFKADLKTEADWEWRTSYGNEFRCVGPVNENDL